MEQSSTIRNMSVLQQSQHPIEIPVPSQGPMFFELFTTINSDGQRIVRSRQVPVTTTDADFSQMMELPLRRRIQPGAANLNFMNDVARGVGGAFRFPNPIIPQNGPVQIGEWVPMHFGGIPMPPMPQMNLGPEMTGANGPGNTAPQLGDPMDNRVEAFNRVIDAVMSIYPELGEGNNAQNITREQSDIIKSILGEANFPISRRMRNLVLREVILRTVVKTPLSATELSQLETKKFSDLPSEQKEDAKCAICITEFSEDESVRIMQCGHFFHQDCIDPYLAKYNNKCPMCREHQAGQYTDAEIGLINADQTVEEVD